MGWTDQNGNTLRSEVVKVGTNQVLDVEWFPVPTAGSLMLRGTLLRAGELEVEIMDLAGSVQLSRSFEQKEGAFLHELDVSDLANGLYVLRLNQGGVIKVGRLMVSR